MTKKNNVNQSFRRSSSEREEFQRKYPYMMSQFLRHCLVKALNDKTFFDYTMFELDTVKLDYRILRG